MLKKIILKDFLEKGQNIEWELNPNVNILVGKNGCGKTMLLHKISHEIRNKALETLFEFTEEFNLSNVDNRGHNLGVELYNSNFNYNLFGLIIEFLKESDEKREKLFTIINKFIPDKIFDSKDFSYTKNGKYHIRDWMSHGEKTLLTIVLTVFAQQEKPIIFLIDDIEKHLGIEWQYTLLETILIINPNCQIICTTHSPAIAMEGWLDRIFNMKDIINKHETNKN